MLECVNGGILWLLYTLLSGMLSFVTLIALVFQAASQRHHLQQPQQVKVPTACPRSYISFAMLGCEWLHRYNVCGHTLTVVWTFQWLVYWYLMFVVHIYLQMCSIMHSDAIYVTFHLSTQTKPMCGGNFALSKRSLTQSTGLPPN